MPRNPSKIPPEIARHRLPGTQIKCIRGRYYIQRVTSRWDPEKQKVRKVVLEHIGTVTEAGIQPKKTVQVKVDARRYSKEFGATWAAMQLSGDLLAALRKHFPQEAEWLYVCALLRCIRHSANRYIEHLYDVSFLSEVFPGLHLSSQNLSNLMTALGTRRRTMVEFMREFVPSRDWYVLVDGTSIVCNSRQIHDAQRGYNSHGCHDPQLNLMYVVAVKDGRRMPVFYKQYPGSVRDVSAFANLRSEAGLEDVVAICDKGFAKKSDQDEMEASGTKYLIPLKRNSGEYSREPLQKPGFDGFQGRFTYAGRIVWYYEQPAREGERHRMYLYLDETLRHLEQSAIRGDTIGRETEAQLARVKESQKMAGTICLKSNMRDTTPEDVYRTYKVREEIEQMFDTYKAEEDFNTTGMHSPETLEACLFLNHLSIMVAYKVYERLRDNNALKDYAAIQLLENYLWDVRMTNTDGKWRVEPIPKASRKAIQALGLALPEPGSEARPMA